MSGDLYIVSAPSGAGKTTLVRELLARDCGIGLSISHTTRAPRPGEQDGREYHFVDVAQFLAMRDEGAFLEWAEVHGNHYGTSAPWLTQRMETGHDVLLEIDWQGARQVRARFPGAVTVFVLPPSMEELERRLRDRGQDSEAVIARRLAAARDEMRHVGEVEYVIVNKDLQIAIADLAAIVRARRLRLAAQRTRQSQLFSSLEQN
ncbi:MAG: guanylate kinase [Betaproteobacteria bacterium]|nr:guanylate kinase [Betaproteobacteria bacterium]